MLGGSSSNWEWNTPTLGFGKLLLVTYPTQHQLSLSLHPGTSALLLRCSSERGAGIGTTPYCMILT